MKLRRKKALNLSFFIMASGFVFSLIGFFGQRILADQTAVVQSVNSLGWLVIGLIGIFLVVIGLIGVVFGVAAFRE